MTCAVPASIWLSICSGQISSAQWHRQKGENMKKNLLVLLVSLLCFVSIKTVSAQDIEISDLLEPKQQELVKVALEANSLTIFLVDTSGNMQNKDKQTTIQLITRYAQESDGSNIAVITYGATAQVLVEPTHDPHLIQEKLKTLTSAGESNLSAGLFATKEMMAKVNSSKTNLFIIADKAPTVGEKMKQGVYKSQDNDNYQYANAVKNTLISKDLDCEYTVTGESTLIARFTANKGASDDS